jgi:hypothetical protein
VEENEQAARVACLRRHGRAGELGCRYNRAMTILGADGALVDDAVRAQLADFMAGFGAFVAAHRRVQDRR